MKLDLVVLILSIAIVSGQDTGLRILGSSNLVHYIANSTVLQENLFRPLLPLITPVTFSYINNSLPLNASFSNLNVYFTNFKGVDARLLENLLRIEILDLTGNVTWTLSWIENNKTLSMTNTTNFLISVNFDNEFTMTFMSIPSWQILNLKIDSQNYSLPSELEKIITPTITNLINTQLNSSFAAYLNTIYPFTLINILNVFPPAFIGIGIQPTESPVLHPNNFTIGLLGDLGIAIGVVPPCDGHNLPHAQQVHDLEIYYSRQSIQCFFHNLPTFLTLFAWNQINTQIKKMKFDGNVLGNIEFVSGNGVTTTSMIQVNVTLTIKNETYSEILTLDTTIDATLTLGLKGSSYQNYTLSVDPVISAIQANIMNSKADIPERYYQQIVSEDWTQLANTMTTKIKSFINPMESTFPNVVLQIMQEIKTITIETTEQYVHISADLRNFN